VPAKLVKVLDGDTVRVRARIWLDQWIEIVVRRRDTDAPGLHGKCAVERNKAALACNRLALLVKGGALLLTEISPDKYAGRVDAIVSAGSRPVAPVLVREGLARPYGGGTRKPWC
jgi:endonuclease YncB( thermonuclease family)